MISFCNYNLVGDVNAIDAVPTNISSVNNTTIKNATYDHFNITKNTNTIYSTTTPTWDYNTELDCTFDNTISGGNINITLSQITSIKVKRRELGTYDWVTIKEVDIATYSDLTFITKDYFAPNGLEAEYAIVPVLNGVDGDYITNSITTQYNGTFISDGETSFNLYFNTSYSTLESSNETDIKLPIGATYPIVISNSSLNYMSGSLQTNIMGANFLTTRTIDRGEIISQTKDFVAFLKNGKAKILKDWNNNIYLVYIVGNVSVENSLITGIANVSFNWVEQGKYNVQLDLYNNGLSDVVD